MLQDPLPQYPTPPGGEFGAPRGIIGGINYGTHNGLDKTAPAGTPVPAAGSGRVIHSAGAFTPDAHIGAGNHIHIEHAGGLETRYNHLLARYVVAGQMVTTATIIGSVGSSGTATGNHLDFQVLEGGVYVDPALYIGHGSMTPANARLVTGDRTIPQRAGKTCASEDPDPATMRSRVVAPSAAMTCPPGYMLVNARALEQAWPSDEELLGEAAGAAFGVVIPPLLEPAMNLAILGGAVLLVYAGIKRALSG